MPRHVCYLGSGHSLHYAVEGTAVTAAEPRPGAELVVIVDVADETQVAKSLPLVRGSGDAGSLSQRRLDREYPGIALKTLVPIRRRPAEGLVDVVMIAADNTGSLTAELAALAEVSPVRGVYTPALLAAHWMKLARLTTRQVLVLMPTPAGIRLMFLDGCAPVLSRLVPQSTPDKVGVEIGRTIQYLNNTQRVARSTRLELWFWGMDDATVTASLPQGDNFELGATPQVSRLANPEQLGFAALLQIAGTRPPAHQLAPHALRASWYAKVSLRWGIGAAASVLLGSAGIATFLLSQTQHLHREAEAVLAADGAYQEQRTALEATLAGQRLTIDELLTMAAAAAALRESQVTATEALGMTARVLGSRSELSLQSLQFQSGSVGQEPAAAAGACAAEAEGGVATLEAGFRMLDGIDVRGSSDALAHVRKSVAHAGNWRSGVATESLGQLQPLAASGNGEHDTSSADWSICLMRKEPA
jgi:hypothetical protein